MNTSNFNWALIPSFLAALEHGSLMGAARATGVSQPTLGRHIAELEEQLKLVLFERTGRGLQPTAQALELAEAAHAMQDGAARFSRMASGSGQTVQGRVRLSASQPVACFLLPPILARMRQALPDVVVDLLVTNSVSNLLMREADMALRMVRPEQSSLVAKQIGQLALRACASHSYLQRKGTPLQPADLLAVRGFIDNGRLSLDGLITHHSDAVDADAAYRTAFGDPACLKMVLNWRDCA